MHPSVLLPKYEWITQRLDNGEIGIEVEEQAINA